MIQIEQIINSIFGQRKKPGRVEKGPVGLQRTRCRYIKVITDFPRDAYDESRLAINNICNLCYKLILCKRIDGVLHWKNKPFVPFVCNCVKQIIWPCILVQFKYNDWDSQYMGGPLRKCHPLPPPPP